MSKFLTLVRHFSALAIGLGLSFVLSTAWAWPPTHGAEFEVTTRRIRSYDFTKKNPSLSDEKKEQMNLVNYMRDNCVTAGCQVTEVPGKYDQDYRVAFADGWWFKISYDPGCVEITFKPSTLEVLKQKKQLINEQIFGSAQSIGLTVLKGQNSHFNIGIRSAFNDSGTEFLRFFVDYSNHPDLALGSLGFDLKNAPPLSVLGEEQRVALQQIVEENATGKLTTIAEIARAIQDRVYTATYDKFIGGMAHYQGIGLKYVNRTDLTQKDAPMELRAIWIQKSAEQFNLVAQLIEGRIQFLRTLKTPIVYAASTRTSFSFSELLTRFYIYVEEAGMKYEDFKTLTPLDVQNARLSPLVNSQADGKSRIAELEKYWDLVETSAYVRAKVVEILALPEFVGTAVAEKWLEKLREQARTQEPVLEQARLNQQNDVDSPMMPETPVKKGWMTKLSGFFKRSKTATPSATAPAETPANFENMFQSMLTVIEASHEASKPRAPITCQSLFQ